MSMQERPWCCTEHRCEPAVISHDHKDLSIQESGKSILCWGRMPRLVEFVYDGVVHSNDLNMCFYTPLKGSVRFNVNAGDLELFRMGSATMLQRISSPKD